MLRCFMPYKDPTQRKEYKRQWNKANKALVKAQQTRHYARHTDKVKARVANYAKRNKQKLAEQARVRFARKYATNMQFRLAMQLRDRLRKALGRHTKQGSAVKLLGCSISEFIAYLERKFQPGMTWENKADWHIDHVKPLALFDLSDSAQLAQACHYTNLQPLWASDNLKKGARFSD